LLKSADVKIRNSYLLLLIFCTGILTSAQNPYIRHLTTTDGLPSNQVYHVYQDSHNFIWFATDAGVARYDGSGFFYLRKRDGLNSNQIINIKEDSQGRLWFFNLNATLNFFQNDTLHNSGNTPFLDALNSKFFFRTFYEDWDKTLYFYKGNGPEFYTLDTLNNVKKYRIPNYMGSPDSLYSDPVTTGNIRYLFRETSGDLNLYTSFGLLKMNNPASNPTRILLDFNIHEALEVSDSVVHFVIDYYKNKQHKIYRYCNNKFTDSLILPLLYYPDNLTSIYEEPDGYLWVATYHNGLIYLKDKEIINHIEIPATQALIRDHEGNIWTSSLKDGVLKISPGFRGHLHYDRDKFINRAVTGLAKHREKGVWCTNGKSVFLLQNGEFYTSAFNVEGATFNQLVHLPNNDLLIGDPNNYLYALKDVRTDIESKSIIYRKTALSDHQIKKIVFNTSGSKISSFYNTYLLLPDSDQLYKMGTINSPSGRIYTTFYNAQNDLCINASKNYRFLDGRFELYEKLSMFNNKIIKDHLVLNDSTELFNIEGDNLFVLNNTELVDLTRVFDYPIDLQINNMVYEYPHLFISTSANVYVVNNLLDALHGKKIFLNPIDMEFKSIHSILYSENTLYIASDDGLTLIPNESICKIKPVVPIPYFKSVIINDKEYAADKKSIVIIGKNRMQFTFGSINYSGSPVIYSYIMEGLDNDWKTGSESNIVYQNLPEGNYKLKLRIRKPTTSWSEAIEYNITVRGTLLQQPLFYVFVLLIILVFIFLLVLWKKNAVHRRRETEHQIVLLEQKALQSMMNPHFIFNTLGSIQNYLLQNKAGDAGLYLSQFARLIRQNLSAINTGMTGLDEEIDRLRNYLDLEQLRMENKFDYQITVGSGIEEDEIKIPSMILQPIVENAIWHGISAIEENGMIIISFDLHAPDALRIIITDNGIGALKAAGYKSQSGKHLHLGMELTRKRLAILGKKMNVKTSVDIYSVTPENPNPGTRVTMIVPFSYGNDLI